MSRSQRCSTAARIWSSSIASGRSLTDPHRVDHPSPGQAAWQPPTPCAVPHRSEPGTVSGRAPAFGAEERPAHLIHPSPPTNRAVRARAKGRDALALGSVRFFVAGLMQSSFRVRSRSSGCHHRSRVWRSSTRRRTSAPFDLAV